MEALNITITCRFESPDTRPFLARFTHAISLGHVYLCIGSLPIYGEEIVSGSAD